MRRSFDYRGDEIRRAFSRKALRRVCEAHEEDVPTMYGLDTYEITVQRQPHDWYAFRDHGSSVLAVAHLDTVAEADERACRFVRTEAGDVVFSRALDDRLGAYVILDLLPALGVQCDVLLTVGEEVGQSTAAYFQPPAGKDYDWIIEFDRGGTDVVMYQYEDAETKAMVEASGARVSEGIFSDISYMEHLGVKAYNWGVGYRDYHGPRAHAFLDDTFRMVDHYLLFHDQWEGVAMPHYESSRAWRSPYLSRTSLWIPSDDDDAWTFVSDDDAPDAETLAEYGEWIDNPTLEEINAALDA